MGLPLLPTPYPLRLTRLTICPIVWFQVCPWGQRAALALAETEAPREPKRRSRRNRALGPNAQPY